MTLYIVGGLIVLIVSVLTYALLRAAARADKVMLEFSSKIVRMETANSETLAKHNKMVDDAMARWKKLSESADQALIRQQGEIAKRKNGIVFDPDTGFKLGVDDTPKVETP